MLTQTNQDLIKRMEHLAAIPLFADLKNNQEALQRFAQAMQDRTYAPQSVIIEDGSASVEMFILIGGVASVMKTTNEGDWFKVAILDAKNHAFFGEGGLISTEVRSASIIADSECECLVLNKEAFEKIGLEKPEWALPFYRQVSNMVLARLRKSNSDLLLLYKALVDEVRGQ